MTLYKSVKEICAIAHEEAIEVIHANGIVQLIKAWLARQVLFFKYRQSLVIVASEHRSGKWIAPANMSARLSTLSVRFLANLALPVSDFHRRRLLDYGLRPEKAITVHNSKDVKGLDRLIKLSDNKYLDFLSESTLPIITYVAALLPFKGHEEYLRAACRVIDDFPQAKFLLVGDGPFRNYLERLAENLDISNQVIFIGDVPQEMVPQIFNKSDVPVHASHSDNLPRSILEAMGVGKAMVATSVGGIPELVKHEITGLLVPPGDVEALAQGILTLLKDSEKREKMGKAARRFIESNNDLPVIGRKLMKAYARAIKSNFIATADLNS